MEYEDPRDSKKLDEHEVLTEDSDNELADLEKEFAARKQKLLEERARARERKRSQVQIERSPSPPPRKSADEAAKYSSRELTDRLDQERRVLKSTLGALRKASQRPKESSFASQLYETKTKQDSVNLNERVFEFENVPKPKVIPTTDENSKDLVSGELLSRRYIPEQDVKSLMKLFKVLRVAKLLAKVIAPKFEEPEYANWCFTGIIMHKSEPKVAVNNKKYLSLRVGSFSHTVDVMLFGEAFQKYWKVRLGDVIVILNPPIRRYNGSFNLALTSDLDNLVEIGSLKSYGHCSATTKLGEPCKHIVDTLKNTFCTYHEESKYNHGSRMELQGSIKPKAPQNRFGEKSQMFFNGSTNQPMFVLYESTGFHQRDVVFSGGQQFDQNKYDRPVVESKISKLRKKKANDDLEKRLLSSVAPRGIENLQKLGIVHLAKDHSSATEKVRKQAFTGTFVKDMGFDPTAQAKDTNNYRAKKHLVSVQELRNLSKGKKVSLKPSKEAEREKQLKWKENVSFISKGNQREKNVLSALLPKAKKTPTIELLDSDSDLEIEYSL